MITQFIPNLEGGGAERVVVNLANEWASRGYPNQIILMEKRGPLLHELRPDIPVLSLESSRIRRVPYKLSSAFQKCKSEITIAHMWPLTTAAVLGWKLSGSPGRLFLCDHVCLTSHIKRELSIPLIVARASISPFYAQASGLIAVSHGVARDLERLAGLPTFAVNVIYNPIVSSQISARTSVAVSERQLLWGGKFSKNLLSIGTLKAQKNHLLLLDAFAKVAEDLDAGLVILGEGQLRQQLEHRICELGLQKRVRLPGFDPYPDPWLRAADLFVLSSDFEGFGNVLVEALAAGTPVLSTACPYGPDEILDKGRYGLTVPVGKCIALANGIRAVFRQSWDPAVLQRRALDFSISRQADAYLNFFGQTSSTFSGTGQLPDQG